MTFNAVREIIGPFLKLSHYIGLRLAIPAFCYMVLSLAISMVSENKLSHQPLIEHGSSLHRSIYLSKYHLTRISATVRVGLSGGWLVGVQ
jgi:hypothetical protein